MQDAKGLVCTHVNRHGGDDAIIAQLDNMDAKRVVEPRFGQVAPPGSVGHGTMRGGRVRMSASISAISRGALLMRSRPFDVTT